MFVGIVVDWVNYLKAELLFGEDDPIFPKTKLSQNSKREFTANGLINEHWADASPIRKTFKTAFENSGLEYYNPHSFRDTLGRLGEKVCTSPEQLKEWSQNLGHESVMTTFNSYGEVPQHRQAEVFDKLRTPQIEKANSVQEIALAVAEVLQSQNQTNS